MKPGAWRWKDRARWLSERARLQSCEEESAVGWGLVIYVATYIGLAYLFGQSWGAKSYEETEQELIRDLINRTRKAGRS